MADEKKKESKEAAPKAAKGSGKKGKGAGQLFEVADASAPLANRPPRLRKIYQEKVVPTLMKKLDVKNPMQVPRLTRIVVNAVTKDAVANPKVLESLAAEIAMITGQKPIPTRAKKAIAAFKLRKGIPLGSMVTLRHKRMYEFMDRLVNVALPRVRDFRGVSTKSFDGRGNYTLGLKEQIIFPEINFDKVDKARGLNITFVTSATDNESARALLAELGMPFRK
ncbi:MAG: 50S ribosomal protein L5 [Proteobacteria bacterium]|nr:MAG: 50S ribosomal protein L5 [Pseudomonadota bacterium]